MSGPVPILLMNYDLRFGGTERQLTEVALHLDRSRFAPHVGCIRLQGGRRGELERGGVPLAEFSFPSFASWRSVAAARRLSVYMRRHRIRLLHTFDVPSTIFGVPAGFCSRIPVVLSSQRAFRELTPGMQHRLLRVMDKLVDGVVVNSANLRQHLEQQDRLSSRHTTLVYNSVDLNRFTPGAGAEVLKDCSVVIGSTAMLRPEKGVGDLVEAFAQVAVRHPEVGLLLVGWGPLYEPLRARVQALGIANRCHFAGGVTDVLPWLRRMDVFVLPSLSEALSNSLLEAMAVGCAAVATEVGGNPELVCAGETGVLFAPGEVRSLSEKLQTLVEDRELRMRLAVAGQSFVRRQFSRENSLRTLTDLYNAQLLRAGMS